MKSNYLQEDLKGKSNFVRYKPLLNRSNSRPKKKRIKINPSA